MSEKYIHFTKFTWDEKVRIKDLNNVEARVVQIIIEDNVRYVVSYFSNNHLTEIRLCENELVRLNNDTVSR